MTPIVQSTLEIAEATLDRVSPEGADARIHRPRLGTGGAFQGVFFWDSAHPSRRASTTCIASSSPTAISIDSTTPTVGRSGRRTTPVPTLAACDPQFNPAGGYRLGASWAPTRYMVLKGVAAIGKRELAARLAARLSETTVAVFEKTNTIRENDAPNAASHGKPGQPDFCGWSGLLTTAIPHEFLGTGI